MTNYFNDPDLLDQECSLFLDIREVPIKFMSERGCLVIELKE